MIQPQLLVTVAGHCTFVAFFISTLHLRPQAPPYHSAPPDSCEEIILIFQKLYFSTVERLFYRNVNPEITWIWCTSTGNTLTKTWISRISRNLPFLSNIVSNVVWENLNCSIFSRNRISGSSSIFIYTILDFLKFPRQPWTEYIEKMWKICNFRFSTLNL